MKLHTPGRIADLGRDQCSAFGVDVGDEHVGALGREERREDVTDRAHALHQHPALGEAR